MGIVEKEFDRGQIHVMVGRLPEEIAALYMPWQDQRTNAIVSPLLSEEDLDTLLGEFAGSEPPLTATFTRIFFDRGRSWTWHRTETQIAIYDRMITTKEYRGQRVVTFQDIDEHHQRPEGTARRNFADNRKHFIEGTDYFRLTCKEAANCTEFVQFNSPNGLVLFTMFGYLMLVKSFRDDRAWRVQRELVNTYFLAHTMMASQTTASVLVMAENMMVVFKECMARLDRVDAKADKALKEIRELRRALAGALEDEC